MREMLEERGRDPGIPGKSRLYGIVRKLRQNAGRDEDFTDLRAAEQPQTSKGDQRADTRGTSRAVGT